MLIHPFADNCIYWLGAPTSIGREEIRVYSGGRMVVFMQMGHTLIHPLSSHEKNKHTPKLLLNTPIDGSTVYQNESHIRAITGQMIEHEVFFVTAD